MKKRFLPVFICIFAVILAGCSSLPAPTSSALPPAGSATASLPQDNQPPPPCYFTEMARQALKNAGVTDEKDDFEKVKAVYRYIIRSTNFVPFENPVLTENWRYLDTCGAAPTIYQTMATGPLLYNIGTCEHYSAALIVLLEEMGFEALYVPGKTFSVDGKLIDHAWTMVKIKDVWYHLDAQLEDNIIRGKEVFYRYYLKGDEDFLAHHVWGQNLTTPDPHSLLLPECPQSAPVVAPEPITQLPAPDTATLLQEAQRARTKAQRPPASVDPTGILPPLPEEYLAVLAKENES